MAKGKPNKQMSPGERLARTGSTKTPKAQDMVYRPKRDKDLVRVKFLKDKLKLEILKRKELIEQFKDLKKNNKNSKKDKRTWQKKNIVKYVDATKTSVLVMTFVNLVVAN